MAVGQILPGNNTQGIYHLEDATDSGRNGITLTNTGSVQFSTAFGVNSKGASFDGSTQKLSSGSATWANIGAGGTFSVMFWCNTKAASQSFGHIVCNRDGTANNWFIAQNATKLAFSGSSLVDFNYVMELGIWRHITITVDGSGNVSLYVDAGYKDKITGQTFTSGNSYFGLGGQGQVSGSWNGYLDEVVFFNKALSSAEVKNFYAWQKGRRTSVA